MKWIYIIGLVLIIWSCNKVPYDQYYTFENTTDTTMVLYVNPTYESGGWYLYTPNIISNVWPTPVTTTIPPHSTYILHGTMVCDYYNINFAFYIYPPKDGDIPYWTGKTNYLNSIPTK